MAVLDILQYPDQRLKQTAARVENFDSDLLEFVSDLEQTMRAGPGGVGIAAPQVGYCYQIAIVDVSARPKTPNNGCLILVNPELTHWEGMLVGREGCMSIPDYTGNVIRAQKIRFKASDCQGEVHEYESEGYEARAVQHELDHLNGLLFIDRLVSRRNDLFKRKK